MCRDNSVTLKKKEETLVTYDCCLNTLYRYAESKDRMYLIEILALLLLIKLKRFEGERKHVNKAINIQNKVHTLINCKGPEEKLG